VFGIVRQNNGFINVYSEPDKGTTFKIYLPRFYGEIEMPAGKQEDIPLKGTESVLVVEDEAQLLDLAKNSLELYGYNVFTAKSPGDAILLCERSSQKFDLLISDVVMPGMNGKELKERLDMLKPGMKVIFMSGYTADVVAHRGILDEGVNFLQKPFSPRSLARKAREVLNG
jgi:DNA-binding NtrC family response regulator